MNQHDSLQFSFDSENYYEILNLSSKATMEEVRLAYEIAMQTFQENSLATYSLFSDEENDRILRKVTLAYMTLIDSVTRREYDRRLREKSNFSEDSKTTTPINESLSSPPKEYSIIAQRAQNQSSAFSERDSRNTHQVVLPVTDNVAQKLSGSGIPLQPSIPKATPQQPSSPPVETTIKAKQPADVLPDLNKISEDRNKNRKSLTQKNQESTERVLEFINSVPHFNGPVLQQIRQIKDIDLHQVSVETCIRECYLKAIEEEDFPQFNAPVYLKGYLTGYAKALQLPIDEVIKDYVGLYTQWSKQKKR